MTEPRTKILVHVSEAAKGGCPQVRCELEGRATNIDLGDLSVLGVFVQCTEPLPADSEVAMSLRFSDASFEMFAHVVQSVSNERARVENRKPGFALLFEHVDEHERARLRKRVDTALALRAASSRPVPNVPAGSTRPSPSTPSKRPTASAPASSAAAQSDELTLHAKLKQELACLAGKPPWAILGISQGADPAEAKRAFFAASKRYHPHLFSRYQLPELQRVVTELFIAHKRACDTMSRKPAARTTQPLRVSMRPAAPEGAPASVVSLAGLLGGKFPGAASLQPSPLPARPSPVPTTTPSDRGPVGGASLPAGPRDLALRPPLEPKFRSRDASHFVHDALKHLTQGEFDQAEANLEKALTLDPLSSNARTWLLVAQARRAKAERKHEAAAAKYREVLVIDPKHHEALTEARKASRATGSLLGRLFGGDDEEK